MSMDVELSDGKMCDEGMDDIASVIDSVINNEISFDRYIPTRACLPIYPIFLVFQIIPSSMMAGLNIMMDLLK